MTVQQDTKTKKPTFMKKKTKQTLFYCAMVALPILQFLIFYVGVNINSILLSFKSITQEMDPVTGKFFYKESFVGLQTFETVLKELFSTEMKVVWKNTFTVYFMNLLLGMPFGVLFSYYIFKKFVGAQLFKILLFLPSVVSGLVLIVMYRYFVVDVLPKLFPAMPDLLDPSSTDAFYTLWVFTWWMGFGSSIMMYVGGMNNISQSVLEYAKLDGVSALQEFVYIIFPLVYPTFVTFIVVGLAGIFTNQMRLFDFYGRSAEMYLRTVGYHLYAEVQKAGTNISKYPHYAAMGVFFTLITVPVTLTARWALQKLGPKV